MAEPVTKLASLINSNSATIAAAKKAADEIAKEREETAKVEKEQSDRQAELDRNKSTVAGAL